MSRRVVESDASTCVNGKRKHMEKCLGASACAASCTRVQSGSTFHVGASEEDITNPARDELSYGGRKFKGTAKTSDVACFFSDEIEEDF